MSTPSKKKCKTSGNSVEGREFADDFITFLNESCTAFHTVEACVTRLQAAGFTRLMEGEDWEIKTMGKYFFTRNDSCLFCFTVGGAYTAGEGFTVLGAHTDSPCFKIKPVTCVQKGDSLMLNTMPYGGGLWHTWFDRDLGVAGRVVIKNKDTGLFSTKLMRIDEPIARISTLAIHLTSGDERASFAPNLHDHCKAILSMDPDLVSLKPTAGEEGVASRLHPCLLRLAAESAGVNPEDIEDMELQLMDTQASAIGGAAGELLFSGRLDNLCSCYQSLRAIIDACEDTAKQATQKGVHMAMLFDHEEVGSSSCTGAGSPLLMDTIKLVIANLADESTQMLWKTLKNSFVVSIDMAHALHPNYPAKHDASMAPKINGGLVIKTNANQRYATNSISSAIFRECAKIAGCPTQEFTVRSDSGCGSTIGPIIATLSGILTIDVGTPQFSMHSIREMMGSEDAYIGYAHLKSVLHNFGVIQRKSSLP